MHIPPLFGEFVGSYVTISVESREEVGKKRKNVGEKEIQG
jgi:hypothetical protein